jgi:hypothetical protein
VFVREVSEDVHGLKVPAVGHFDNWQDSGQQLKAHHKGRRVVRAAARHAQVIACPTNLRVGWCLSESDVPDDPVDQSDRKSAPSHGREAARQPKELRTFKRGKWDLSLGRIDLSLRRSAGILFGGSLASQERVSARNTACAGGRRR